MLSFFPRDVLDQILNFIESVSEVFLPTLVTNDFPDSMFYLQEQALGKAACNRN